ncbi:peptidase [Dichomitus squalens LYAD-421 SS1]|uniref:Peptide hydrolase n=1 Tax=Dichomitus squalens (strain LYAD-421) TaxID=732165 RepID=R7ST97_DICSQ|nr:peptidase [Dichomitus squalens LYAD-421 SS1]EJF59454.1 peptidase [Dichomitus squalens LYAD-421 SS1]
MGDVVTTESHPGFDLDLSAPCLVQLEGQEEPMIMTELEKIQAKAHGIRFFDVTDTPELGTRAHLRVANKPSYPAPNNTQTVKSVIESLKIQNLQDILAKFTSFRTRHYRSQTGKESQRWLLRKITELTEEYAPEALQESISIREFDHSWQQSSIIVGINGTSADDDGVVILGAHLDSTNDSPFLPAPGADDDGSGTTSILEAYRALIEAGFRPERTVEFHWYSAEEGGLLGSQAVVKSYESRGVNVIAMSQYDMTAWVKRGTKEEVGIVTDYTDPDLTEFNKKLVEQYLSVPWVETKCGHACSDHASWNKAGYPSVFTIESAYENVNVQYVHTQNDTYDISDEFSFEHMLEFSKLAVGFAIELGGWKKSS